MPPQVLSSVHIYQLPVATAVVWISIYYHYHYHLLSFTLFLQVPSLSYWWTVSLSQAKQIITINFNTHTLKQNKEYKFAWPVSPVRVLSIIILVPLPCPLCACCCSSLSHGGSNSSCYWSAGTAVCSTTVWCSAWTLLRFISRESCTRNNNRCLKPPSLNLPAAVHETKKETCFSMLIVIIWFSVLLRRR